MNATVKYVSNSSKKAIHVPTKKTWQHGKSTKLSLAVQAFCSVDVHYGNPHFVGLLALHKCSHMFQFAITNELTNCTTEV